jgi:hypothetical protein
VKREQLIASAFSYQEYVGGLGDAILRMYFSGEVWYKLLERLPPKEHAVITLMCHNPYLAEVWQWHPKRKQIHVVDLGFTTPFHPWENKEWRVANGLPPEAPCPPHAPAATMEFYPSISDWKLLTPLMSNEPYIVLAATAGGAGKSFPDEVRRSVISAITKARFKCLVVGRSMYLKREGRDRDAEPAFGVIDAVDKLSVPGMIEAVKGAAGVVSADTSVLHAAWQEHRPVFLLYNQWTAENLVPRGPGGYMQGIDRPDTDHMQFSEYTNERFSNWAGKL